MFCALDRGPIPGTPGPALARIPPIASTVLLGGLATAPGR